MKNLPNSFIVLNWSFPAETGNDLTAVANSVLAAVFQRLRAEPPEGLKPIECKVGERPFIEGFDDRYLITINEVDRYFARFAYQLAHELGHMMLGTKRANHFIETLATAISFQILVDIGEIWSTEAPYQNWIEYAPRFKSYKTATLNHYISDLPEEVKMAVSNKKWYEISLFLRFKSINHNYIDLNSMENRGLNHLGAEILLRESIPWQELVGLAHLTNPSPIEHPMHRADLPLELNLLPISLIPTLQKIGVGCKTPFFAAKFSAKPEIPEEKGFLFQENDLWIWLMELETQEKEYWEQYLKEYQLISCDWSETT